MILDTSERGEKTKTEKDGITRKDARLYGQSITTKEEEWPHD